MKNVFYFFVHKIHYKGETDKIKMVGYVVEFYLTKTIVRVKFEWMLNDFFCHQMLNVYTEEREDDV